jgi:hypothetical protein
MPKFTVTYTVKFEAEVTTDDETTLADAISDIFIPEDNVSTYVDNSLKVLSVEDENGQSVPLAECS